MTQIISADDFDITRYIRPGDTVLVAQGASTPQTLAEKMVAAAPELGEVNVFLGSNFVKTFDPAVTPNFKYRSFCGIGPGGAALAKAGRLDIHTTTYGKMPELFASGRAKADVVLLQLSAPWNGRSTIGLCNDYSIDAARHARTVIVEINDQIPWLAGAELPDDLRIDVAVHTSRQPIFTNGAVIDDTSIRIADYVAALIPDGAVVQTGIGSIPDAIMSALQGHKDLGIHSGMIGDRVVELIEAGVITNSRKPIDTGLTVTNTILGTQKLNDFVHRNMSIRMYHTAYTHDYQTLAQLPDLIAINSAVEVDVTGQVNAEIANGVYLGAVGGQPDFVRGALAAPRGKSIITFLSTARGGSVSRIVPHIQSGVVTTSRNDADIVVTEWGVAHLRGKTLFERVRAMIAIAAPQFRESLEASAKPLLT